MFNLETIRDKTSSFRQSYTKIYSKRLRDFREEFHRGFNFI